MQENPLITTEIAPPSSADHGLGTQTSNSPLTTDQPLHPDVEASATTASNQENVPDDENDLVDLLQGLSLDNWSDDVDSDGSFISFTSARSTFSSDIPLTPVHSYQSVGTQTEIPPARRFRSTEVTPPRTFNNTFLWYWHDNDPQGPSHPTIIPVTSVRLYYQQGTDHLYEIHIRRRRDGRPHPYN